MTYFPDILRGQLKTLGDQRSALLLDLDAINDTVKQDNRSKFNDDENAAFDAIVAQIRALDAESAGVRERLLELEEIEAKRNAASKAPQYLRGADYGGSQIGATPAIQSRDAALRTLERTADQLDTDAAARLEEDLRRVGRTTNDTSGAELVCAIGDDAYLRAFSKIARDPVRGHMEFEADEQAAYVRAQEVSRAINIGTDAQGGFLMPLTLDPSVMLTSDGVIDPLRQISRVVTTTTDHWKGITSAGVTAEYAAEGTEVADGTPTDLAQPEVVVHRGDCYVEVTLEGAMDLDFVNQLGVLFQDAKANIEGEKFWAGTGTNQPAGVVTGLDGTSSEIAPATAEAFAEEDIYTLLEAVPPRFRNPSRCSWVANLAIINLTRQFETSTGGNRVMQESLNDGTPMSMLGRRLYEASESDDGFDPSATADNFILTVGDFRAGFVIADRLGSMMTIHDLVGANNRPTGARGYALWFRNGSEVVNAAALRMLSIPTTA